MDTKIRIGDFSKIAQVSIRMLRHYDQMDLLKPAHIDPSSGYRGYELDQLPRLSRILFLKDLGFSLTDVKALIDTPMSLDEMKEMLSKRQAELLKEIEIASHSLYAINNRLKRIESEGQLPAYDVLVKSTEAFTVASIRGIVPSLLEMDHYCQTMYAELYHALEAVGLDVSGTEITFYHTDEYVETDLDMEVSVVIAGIDSTGLDPENLPGRLKIRTLEAEAAVASLIYEGPFEAIENGFIELIKWLATHGWEVSGPAREHHLTGKAHSNAVASETIAELQIPMKKAEK